jgi:GH24 family phage-related lysozyme (muramidase)
MSRLIHWPSKKTDEELAEKTVEGVAIGAAVRVVSMVLAASAASAAVAVVATQSGPPATHISAKGIALIERHEGVRYFPYQDPSGIPACTVGAGHVLAWKYCTAAQLATRYTPAQVVALLRSDVATAERCVQATGELSQPTLDALVDLTFNAGCGSLGWHEPPYYRTLASLAGAGELELLAAEVRHTATTAGGKQLAGLVSRRADEATLILTGYYGPGIGYYLPPKPAPPVKPPCALWRPAPRPRHAVCTFNLERRT